MTSRQALFTFLPFYFFTFKNFFLPFSKYSQLLAVLCHDIQ